MTEERRCSATTKAGTPCKAQPLDEHETCLAHADEKTRDEHGFGGSHGGRPAKPRVVDALKARVEAEIDKWLEPLIEAREATRHIVVGNGPSAYVEEVPDIPTRLAAVREVLDRIYGRPKQVSEITGADGGPIEHRELIPTERSWHQEVAEVLAEAEAIKS